MAKKKSTAQPKHWFIAPAELFVFSLAGCVIWVAKHQDQVLAAQYSAALPSHSRPKTEASAAAYIPSLGYRAIKPFVQREIPLHDDSIAGVTQTSGFGANDSLATQTSGLGIFVSPQAEIKATEVISQEEKRFFTLFLRHRSLFAAKVLSEKEKNALLKNAAVTFSFVESTFAKHSSDDKPNASPSEILRNATKAQQVFADLEQRFGISPKEASLFAKKNRANLSDWALFVEQQQR